MRREPYELIGIERERPVGADLSLGDEIRKLCAGPVHPEYVCVDRLRMFLEVGNDQQPLAGVKPTVAEEMRIACRYNVHIAVVERGL